MFRDFLRCEYSEENILFWLACEELKKESNPDVVEEKARFIYEDYISILSPKEVSDSFRPAVGPRVSRVLYVSLYVTGEPGRDGPGDREPQHGGPDAAHVRRGADADLHADAQRLVPAVRQLDAVQEAGAAQQRRRRGRRQQRHPHRPQGEQRVKQDNLSSALT